jgi:branched chain amino acid efflux pump
MSAVLAIVVIGIGTYLERLSFIGFIGDRSLPDWTLLPLRYVAPAVFAALVAPTVLLQDGRLSVLPGSNAEPLATLVALAVAWRTRNVLATVAAGMAALWVLQAVF